MITSGPMIDEHEDCPDERREVPVLLGELRRGGREDQRAPISSPSAEIRNGEYRRISGAIATEYTAHVAEPS